MIHTAEQFGLFPPGSICLDKLTQGKFQAYQPSMRELAVRAYSEKDVFSVFWEQPGGGFSLEWVFTFYKSSRPAVPQPSFRPWNTLTLKASYDWLSDKRNEANYLEACKALFRILNPFYASIDDVAHAVSLLKKARAPHFVPDTIQQVYWGNYWGGGFAAQIEAFRARQLPVFQFEEIQGGVFFTLSDSIFDFDSAKVNRLRRQIRAGLPRSKQCAEPEV